MYYEERQELNGLLLNLCSVQDDVTHMNEKGSEHTEQARALIIKRDGIRHDIVRWVQDLLDSRAQQ